MTTRIRSVGYLILSLLGAFGISSSATAQCAISVVPSVRTDPGFHGFGLDITGTGGTSDTSFWIEYFYGGLRYTLPGQGNPGSSVHAFQPLTCLYAGHYDYHVQVICDYADTGRTEEWANYNGSFDFDPRQRTQIRVDILNPPDPQGTIKVTYSFSPNAGKPYLLVIPAGDEFCATE